MSYRPDLPMIVQSDRTVLLETQHPLFAEARQAISGFCELLKSPEYIHTYRITPLSLWNAAASGLSPNEVTGVLGAYSKYGVPPTLVKEIEETMRKYGLIRLERHGDDLVLNSDDPLVLTELTGYKSIAALFEEGYTLKSYARGLIKQELIKLGLPVQDLAGYSQGKPVRSACGRPVRRASRLLCAPIKKTLSMLFTWAARLRVAAACSSCPVEPGKRS